MGEKIDNVDIEDYYNAELISRTYPEVCSIENPRDNCVTFAGNLSELKKLENIDKSLFVLVPDIKEINKYYKSKKLGSNITVSFCQDVNHAFVTIFNKLDKKVGENIVMKEKVERMGMDDSKTATRLLEKNYSPLIVRKYQAFGWPLFVSLICDVSLSDLDKVVYECIDGCERGDLIKNDIQSQRNFCGLLSDRIIEHYDRVKRGCVEGVAVLVYWDKCFCSSLWGDFMVHTSCKQELFSIIQTLPHI